MMCHRSFHILSGVVTASMFYFTFSEAAMQLNSKVNRIEEHSHSLVKSPLPWLGVLRFGKEYERKINKVIPVIMISDKTGIADARSMALLNKYNWENIKNHTYVMFLTKESIAWYAQVAKYILHPEYNDDTLTTIAFVTLDREHDYLKDNELRWPYNYSNPSAVKGQMFAFGYTNQKNILKQTIYDMDFVKFSDCQKFYVREELDSKWMRPKHYHCFHVRYSKETCVFEPGMVLVHYAQGKYTLMGISTWGPGCTLPARFVDFEPFVPWVMSKMNKRPTRRIWTMETINITRIDRDKWMLERIRDDQGLALRPLKKNNVDMEKEVVHGNCDNLKDGKLIYREVTNFSFPDANIGRHEKTLAVYGLSLYDLEFHRSQYTCIQVLAKCKAKSDTKLEYTKGFEQLTPFEPYIKRVPIQHSSYKNEVYKPYVQTVKENWETYNYEVLGSEITNLIFRFEFEMDAVFEVDFFGKRTEPTTTTTTTAKTPPDDSWMTRKRKLKPHTTVTVTTPPPDYYYDGWWFVKGPKQTNKNKTTATKTTTTKSTTTNSHYWFNKWWKFNQKDHSEWWKG